MSAECGLWFASCQWGIPISLRPPLPLTFLFAIHLPPIKVRESLLLFVEPFNYFAQLSYATFFIITQSPQKWQENPERFPIFQNTIMQEVYTKHLNDRHILNQTQLVQHIYRKLNVTLNLPELLELLKDPFCDFTKQRLQTRLDTKKASICNHLIALTNDFQEPLPTEPERFEDLQKAIHRAIADYRDKTLTITIGATPQKSITVLSQNPTEQELPPFFVMKIEHKDQLLYWRSNKATRNLQNKFWWIAMFPYLNKYPNHWMDKDKTFRQIDLVPDHLLKDHDFLADYLEHLGPDAYIPESFLKTDTTFRIILNHLVPNYNSWNLDKKRQYLATHHWAIDHAYATIRINHKMVPFFKTWFHDPIKLEQLLSFNPDYFRLLSLTQQSDPATWSIVARMSKHLTEPIRTYIRNLDTPSLKAFLNKHPDF